MFSLKTLRQIAAKSLMHLRETLKRHRRWRRRNSVWIKRFSLIVLQTSSDPEHPGMFKSEIHRVKQCNNHLCLCSETFIKHWAEGINNFHWIEMMFIWRVACDFGVSLVMAAKECVCNTYYPFRFR